MFVLIVGTSIALTRGINNGHYSKLSFWRKNIIVHGCEISSWCKLFALVTIEDKNAAPDDKKLIQMVSDKIGKEFIATAEDNKTLRVMFDLEQLIGKEII